MHYEIATRSTQLMLSAPLAMTEVDEIALPLKERLAMTKVEEIASPDYVRLAMT